MKVFLLGCLCAAATVPLKRTMLVFCLVETANQSRVVQVVNAAHRGKFSRNTSLLKGGLGLKSRSLSI